MIASPMRPGPSVSRPPASPRAIWKIIIKPNICYARFSFEDYNSSDGATSQILHVKKCSFSASLVPSFSFDIVRKETSLIIFLPPLLRSVFDLQMAHASFKISYALIGTILIIATKKILVHFSRELKLKFGFWFVKFPAQSRRIGGAIVIL